MTPPEAIEHALALLQCAEAATSDAILCGFLRDKCGLQMEQMAGVLQAFRALRDKLSPQKAP